MKTMVELDENKLNEIVILTGAKSKKKAILVAIDDYLKMKKREALKSLIGNYAIDLDLKALEKIRSED
ncbi:MAG: hypothetical protein HZA78_05030 [Candidatus Schekmanbacteria bacterium]|nr:hypothetical protein [Candidatus Schekmanbacteria bacterium]